jgi:signal transduction histidine kinase
VTPIGLRWRNPLGSQEQRPKVLKSWPVIVGLGLVALLVVGMIGLDLYFSEQESFRTADIIENAQRSIILLTDLRHHTKHLASARETAEIERWKQAIAETSRSYDPIATYKGERDEWIHLQDLIEQLVSDADRHAWPIADLEDAIDKSVGVLVAINTVAGQGNLTAIRAAHRQAILSDVIVGGIVLAIVAIICGWLLRVLSRQRRLVVERVQFLHEQNAELEAFAGRAAHDLRSPMNPMRGYTDLILESPSLPENVAAMAQRIRRAVDRMARVVDDMLALSVSGRPPEGRSSTDVVIARMIEEMGAELQGVAMVTKLSAGQVVACAEGVLSQILRNLIGNAIKFRARSRALSITIETRDVGAMVEIVVEDNGIGMDPENAKHAFEPFYRGLTTREVPGHGLGLAIVERTTRALGGSCQLWSVPDRSTRIAIRLPRA